MTREIARNFLYMRPHLASFAHAGPPGLRSRSYLRRSPELVEQAPGNFKGPAPPGQITLAA
ncbi:MAG: hypothetical protein VX614_10600 [Myxococcota bacterium]|nr:hypothetical protein [Myxococcota bacterium]